MCLPLHIPQKLWGGEGEMHVWCTEHILCVDSAAVVQKPFLLLFKISHCVWLCQFFLVILSIFAIYILKLLGAARFKVVISCR